MLRAMTIAIVLLATPAVAESGRLSPGNPWYRDFEATCRSGVEMASECMVGVQDAYRAYSGTENVMCSAEVFWRVSDELNSQVFAVLPWQNGVEAIVRVDGVCAIDPTVKPADVLDLMGN